MAQPFTHTDTDTDKATSGLHGRAVRCQNPFSVYKTVNKCIQILKDLVSIVLRLLARSASPLVPISVRARSPVAAF